MAGEGDDGRKVMNLGKREAPEEVEQEAGLKRQLTATGCRETAVGGSSNVDGAIVRDDTLRAVAALAAVRDGGRAALVVVRDGGRVPPPLPRRLWVKERSSSWWQEVSSQWYPEVEFKRAFRMSRRTFMVLCGELAAAVAKGDTALREAIPVRKRIAVCVWRLASGESLREVAARFGLGISTCHKLSLEVSAAIKNLLMQKLVVWPQDAASADAAAAGFRAAHGVPNVIGAICNTHIAIIAPPVFATSYLNEPLSERSKKWCYSMTAQLVADATGTFTDISVGHPGGLLDEDVLLRSSLHEYRGATGNIQAQGKWLLGGASYPVTDWMLAPYAGEELTPAQRLFNEKAEAVLSAARGAVMRLKARWKLLQKRSEMKLIDFPVTISACCLLHNLCERNGDTLDPDLAIDVAADEVPAKTPVRSQAAALVRDSIATSFLVGASGVGSLRTK